VAGIETALRIASAGYHVDLVERTATIGGHMAMFDKTFPTLDCAACILTPKMVAVGQHENIDILNCAEVQAVSGTPGDYRVRVLRRARRVDPDACIACHACRDVCPTRVPSEFDEGIVERKAVYMAFPQAIPNSYVIDGEHCTWVRTEGKKCGACAKKCPKDAIHLDEEPRTIELKVGNIVVATGFDPFDARRIERYGYGKLPNVLTALEFERLTNASGPTGGKIVIRSTRLNKRTKQQEWVFEPESRQPESVAIIHCVGSRDANFNRHCSRVCCMYSLKFAHLVKEKLPQATCYQFYIDMRAFGKGYEEFFERIKDEGCLLYTSDAADDS
jgi:heterodisulfide reductase subunit A